MQKRISTHDKKHPDNNRDAFLHDASFNCCSCATFCAVSNIFSANMPLPFVESSTNTCVTAPTNFPFWIMELPDTSVSI